MDAHTSAGDFSRALELIATAWPALASTRGDQLRAAIRLIPERLWNEDAWIITALGASYRSVDSCGSPAALPHFELAERLVAAGTASASDLPAILLHHAASLRGFGRLDAARSKAESAWALLQDDLGLTLPLRLALQAEASLQLGLVNLHEGNIVDAVGQLRLASGLSENGVAATDVVECLGGLAFAAYSVGEFDQAERFISEAKAVADEPRLLHSRFGAPALATEMLIAVDRYEASKARAGAAALAASAHRTDWEPLAFYARAAAAAINGQLIEALDLQRRCAAATRGWDGTPAIRSLAELLRAGLHLHLGESEHAAELLDTLTPLQDHISCPDNLLAGIRFAATDFAGCLEALADCAAIGDAHSSRTLIDVLLLMAAANYELGNLVAADVAFDRALYLGSQTGIRVPFHTIPRITMLRMLGRAADRYQPDPVHRLLDELRAGSATSAELTEPLSDRELDIVQHLFQDKTVGQIAADLYISANTVKTHVRSIYRKLSATSRKEAVRRVHELGLDLKITPF
ncbi:MAG TPA: LuxR C-terminal-related transcriptional regulator [Homoserinimonas sp.]|nr:LuxR C-terminal-related transcriptional regulator [Homoserinimonas sp.]